MQAASADPYRAQEEAFLMARALSTQVSTLRISRSLGDYRRIGAQIDELERQAIALVRKLEQTAIPF